jgi:MoaA/NifB/PqqE/SkfB family radical SAM enzyme
MDNLEFAQVGRHKNIFEYNKEINENINVKNSSDLIREIPCTDKDLGYHFLYKEWIEYRKKWENNPANFIVEKLPIQLDVWAVDACNLKCPMCPRTLGNASNKIMKPKLLDKIFEEIEEHKLYALNLGGLGEPTMLPKFTEYIKRAKNLGVVDVNAHTNGTLLKPNFVDRLLDSGIDRLIVSLDAVTKERFEVIRVGANYERVYKQVNDLIAKRDKLGLDKPHIKLNIIDMSVGDNKEKEINKFYEYWKNKVNRIAVLPLFEYDEDGLEVAENPKSRKYSENFSCGWLWQRMSITTSGKVVLCIRDISSESQYIGDINDQSISEIWNGETINEIRELHKTNNYRKNKLCTYCPNAVTDWKKTIIV